MYKVYFEIFGKRLVVEVKADSKLEAIEYVKGKVDILKVEQMPPSDDYVVEYLKTMFGWK